MPTAVQPRVARDVSLDAVRVAGVFAIVVGHGADADSDAWNVALFTWHVPVFFFLSGYLWVPGRTLADEVSRRTSSLLRPYAAWLLVLGVPFVAYVFAFESAGDGVARLLRVALGGSYMQSPFHAYWFVLALFFACVFYRVLERCWPWSPLWLLPPLMLLAWVGSGGLWGIPASIGTAVPCIAYLILGQWARTLPAWTRSGVFGAALLAAAMLVTWLDLNVAVDVKYTDFGLPVSGIVVPSMISLGLIGLAGAIVPRVPGATALVEFVAPLALGIVLTHSIPNYFLGGHIPAPALQVLSLATGLLFALAARHSPWRSALLGR